MQKKVLLLTLGLYLASTALSYGAFSYFGGNRGSVSISDQQNQAGDEETLLSALLTIDPNAPKDQPCPLNGKMYTQIEREAWEKRRPLAIMIENAPDARPQSGLSDADVMFEAVAEGGVTRFMGLFYCDVQAFDTTVAPVRSARTYFVDWASGFNYPLYVHVGGANTPGPADALGQINTYGWALENDMNQFSIGYPTFVRNANRLDRQVATEHTMESSTELLWDVAEERGWTNMSPERVLAGRTVPGTDWKAGFEPWTFADDVTTDGTVNSISYDFWSGYGQYSIDWQYDAETNTYLRNMGGEPHVDLNTEEQIRAKNVIVMLSEERGPIDELKHLLYQTTGTGQAVIFMNGEAAQGTWSKPTREAELRFTDARGQDIALARGLTWISVLDPSFELTY